MEWDWDVPRVDWGTEFGLMDWEAVGVRREVRVRKMGMAVDNIVLLLMCEGEVEFERRVEEEVEGEVEDEEEED